MPKRPTVIPDDACPIWTMHEITHEQIAAMAWKYGLILAGSSSIVAALVTIGLMVWLMPRTEKVG